MSEGAEQTEHHRGDAAGRRGARVVSLRRLRCPPRPELLSDREEPSLLLELLTLVRPSAVQSTVAHELHHTPKLVGVEPGAVLGTTVEHDPGSLPEVDTIHQPAAVGAGHVPYLIRWGVRHGARTRVRAEEHRAPFFLGAESLELPELQPGATAPLAFLQLHAAESEITQGATAVWTWTLACSGFDRTDRDAAMRAMLAADEHEAEAGGACRGGQPRQTERAGDGIRARGGAALWAGQGGSVHGMDRG